MKLVAARVAHFESVTDSDWFQVDEHVARNRFQQLVDRLNCLLT